VAHRAKDKHHAIDRDIQVAGTLALGEKVMAMAKQAIHPGSLGWSAM
jgi:hypothetical protein